MQSDKYSIAWFKIAESVARAERERALGIYRLLSHALSDDALAEQLAGDLLLAFDDIAGAIERYKNAGQRYARHNKLLEAAAVYEHLVTLEPHVDAHRMQLIEWYRQLKSGVKIEEHTRALRS